MFLIMSAAYVDHELQSEFGRIPPSFLPLGNRRLFQHQVKLAPKNSKIYISVPDSFNISYTDKEWLKSKDVSVLNIPSGLSLGESLIASLNLSSHSFDSPLHILFGDTLFLQLPVGENIIGLSEAEGHYNWASSFNENLDWIREKSKSGEFDSVVNGYFKISSPRELIRCITKAKWNMYAGFSIYNKKIGIQPIQMSGWLDFGHVNTYYRSKASFTTQRAFNELKITQDWIEKKSIKNDKIEAEANWFAQVPSSLALFTPQYLGSEEKEGQSSYKLEYLYQTALNELLVFSSLPEHVWERILRKCISFLNICKAEQIKEGCSGSSLMQLFGHKTAARISEYCDLEGISKDSIWSFNKSYRASINEIITHSEKYLPNSAVAEPMTIMHGDFCFSNILYDFRTNRIKVIDPRGMNLCGEKTIYGDVRYDIAKLSHSILGLYDYIIAGYYKVGLEGQNIFLKIDTDDEQYNLQRKYVKLIEQEFGLSEVNLIAMQIQLFLSMLPLHSDDKARQNALFANVFRLYGILKGLLK
ncbi:capsular biosynthesis protein [Pseudoalteromonas atlantica]|uniref:capsular biosynthesis protein n=1 Tax=Pseudoalteromonas atlantica TaxID=288 RepID=UPI0037361A7D